MNSMFQNIIIRQKLSFYMSNLPKQILTFFNELILQKQTFAPLLRLVSGKAQIVNNQQIPIYDFQQHELLNWIECTQSISSLKNVRANGKCIVEVVDEILIKQITNHHQNKWSFNSLVFADINPSNKMQIIRYAKQITIQKQHRWTPQRDYIYFIVNGSATLIDSLNKMKLLHADKGQMIIFYPGIYFEAENKSLHLLSISQSLFKQLAENNKAEIFQNIKKLKTTVSIFVQRNQRIRQQCQRQRLTVNQRISPCLINKIQARADRLTHFKQKVGRSSSSASAIVSSNKQKYQELMQLNRRKYGQDYIYRKRLQISRKVHSTYSQHHDSQFPFRSRNLTKDSNGINDIALSIYQIFSLKEHFGVVKRHPEIQKSRRKRAIKIQNQNNLIRSIKKVKVDLQKNKNLFLKCRRLC